MLKSASLYSLNSGHKYVSFILGVHSSKRTPGIEPVRRQEHGEKEDDHRIRAQRKIQAVQLDLPARVARRGHLRPVSTDHLVRVSHEYRDGDPNESEDQKPNLGNRFVKCGQIQMRRVPTYVPFPTAEDRRGE